MKLYFASIFEKSAKTVDFCLFCSFFLSKIIFKKNYKISIYDREYTYFINKPKKRLNYHLLHMFIHFEKNLSDFKFFDF